jgi:hypothetical protein
MSDEVLVDNLLLTFPDSLQGLSSETKQLVLIERVQNCIEKIVEHLNETYEDIHFYTKITSSMFEDTVNSSGQSIKYDFDKHGQSDEEEEEDNIINLDEEMLYMPWSEISIKLVFTRKQQCNLGHFHKNTRFYYYSMPRIMELISVYLNDPNWKDGFVKKYVPNFFEIEQ